MLGTDEIDATTLGERSVRSAINGPITLGFPARPQPVRLARLVSAAVAGSVDASIDDIEDLRIAVGEACAILVGHATTDGRVEITIAVGSDSMTFDSRLTGGRCDDPQVDELAQLVLGSLADDVDFRLLDTGASLTFRWPLAAAVDADAKRRMTSRASATRSERRSRAELRRADNEQLLEWWIADRADNVRAELAERYQQMAQNLAARFANRGESRDDLAQVASFGILKALDRYSPDRGGSFESYAVPTAVGEIKRHFRDHAWGSKVSRGVKDLMPRVRQAEEALTARLDRSPTVAEVAAEADLPAETVDEVLEARRMFRPNSLEGRPEGAPDPAVGDVGIQHGVDRILVEGLLERLPDRERTILEMRFFEELNQSDIAERVGVSQMHVSRLIKRALERLATLVERNE